MRWATNVFKRLRKPKSIVSYKEPKESDIYSNIPCSKRRKSKPKDELFPIEVVDEDASRYKVHYVGFSSTHDEWTSKEEVVDLASGEDSDSLNDKTCMAADRFSLYRELATKIKLALNSSRKESPEVRIDMPFDKIEFQGGLMQCGVKKRYIRGIQRFCIQKYQDLNGLLGKDWHFRGLNSNGDFRYIILSTVEFYLYNRRPIKEYFPSDSCPEPLERTLGNMLVFTFVKGDGTPAQFGKDRNIFVNE